MSQRVLDRVEQELARVMLTLGASRAELAVEFEADQQAIDRVLIDADTRSSSLEREAVHQ